MLHCLDSAIGFFSAPLSLSFISAIQLNDPTSSLAFVIRRPPSPLCTFQYTESLYLWRALSLDNCRTQARLHGVELALRAGYMSVRCMQTVGPEPANDILVITDQALPRDRMYAAHTSDLRA